MGESQGRLVVLISHNADDDKATVGFTIANTALSMGLQVAVFLTSDGVELAREGSCDLAHVRPFKPISELVESFVEKGGIVWASGPCHQHRGLRNADNIDKVVVTGAGPLLEWVTGGAATLCL